MTKEWSKYQKAIFEDFKSGQDGTVVQARAGSGKTTALVEGLNHLPDGLDTLLCAFNKAIQQELETRAPRDVTVKTLHSIGYGAIRRNLDSVQLDQHKDKTRHLIRDLYREWEGEYAKKEQVGALIKLVGMAKNTLVNDQPGLIRLAYDYGIDEKDFTAEQMAPFAEEVLKRSLKMPEVIEFDDMIWFPYMFNWKLNKYDVVCVDEAQDLCPAQIWMVKNMVRKEGRMIAVGDSAQAIYGFRGADSQAMGRVVSGFSAKTLKLPLSYRCPKSVVRLAQKYVPDFEWWDQAPEGIVEHVRREKMFDEAKPGDFILSRKNAPLANTCLTFLRKNVPAVIAGRDIGSQLATLVKKADTEDVDELDEWLTEFVWAERKRLTKAGREEQLELIQDKVEAIRVFMEGETKVFKVISKIEGLFTDSDPYTKIVCSSVHRSKGLERKTVWLLVDTFRDLSQPNSQEEKNIFYVACTRSQESLYLVKD